MPGPSAAGSWRQTRTGGPWTSGVTAAASATPRWAPAPSRWSSGTRKRSWERPAMDIDLSVLRSLESEKDISLDLAIKAIEDALLVAYHKSGDSAATARVAVDRR